MDAKELLAEVSGNMRYINKYVTTGEVIQVQVIAGMRAISQYISSVLTAHYETPLKETTLRNAERAAVDMLARNRLHIEQYALNSLARLDCLMAKFQATIHCCIKYPDAHDERKKAIRQVVAHCRSFEQSFPRL